LAPSLVFRRTLILTGLISEFAFGKPLFFVAGAFCEPLFLVLRTFGLSLFVVPLVRGVAFRIIPDARGFAFPASSTIAGPITVHHSDSASPGYPLRRVQR
ncbi:MAG TPA: hypothetical protein VFD97_05410, partial [Acidimicrobiia bacterium]|nr:hypothetical protein [Acidimicrobiia bacterium]